MPGPKSRLHRTRTLLRAVALGTAALLGACVAPSGTSRQGGPLSMGGAPDSRPVSAGRKIAVLLPLTGPNAELGQAMLKAVQLALSEPGSPELIQQDTGGTPDGAAAAARAALAADAGIILGPLLATETAAAGPVARAANVPVLAFTSDSAQGQAGIWALGITPAQQVHRLVLAVAAENRPKLTAVLPQNIFGEALANGLIGAAKAGNLPEPKIVRAPATFPGFNDALKEVSNYAGRRGMIEAQQRTARARNDADGRREAAEIGRRPPSAPPMDVLFVGATGELLGSVVPLLAFYDVAPGQVRVLGPGTWAREATRQPALAGAWFAAPDPAQRGTFEKQFSAKYNVPARDYASIAFDAATIARTAMTRQGVSLEVLLRQEGFRGADGVVGLVADGTVRRGLAVFEVDRGSTHMVQPAPQTLAAPGA